MGIETNASRRCFLNRLSHTFALGSVAGLLPQLALVPRAQAQTATDYRALVCIYLAGANDSFNWLVPRDSADTGSRYDTYRVSRGGVYGPSNTSGLALSFNDLLPITPDGETGNFGLHPSNADFSVTNGGTQAHSGLQTLFGQGKAAFVCNAGPLVQPISKAEYNAGAPRPPQLFSHNDQELQWHLGMSAGSHPMARFGWGGRVAKSSGAMALSNGLSPNISIAGSSRFLLGDQITPYQIGSGGLDLLDNYSATSTANFQSSRRALLDDILDDPSALPMERGYATIARRSLGVGESLSTLLNGPDGNVAAIFPAGNNLADQLKMVARMIKASRTLGARRQVYYVRYGSFDLHTGMFDAGQPVASSGHGQLMTAVNQAIGAFWTALGELGARSQVTTFTMSDFGRTLTGNGSGSDHAWGGNLLVLGDAVRGKRLYGTYPKLTLNAEDNSTRDYSFARGQYIPTTGVDQVAATLARWMGVTDSAALGAIFPNLSKFAAPDLGFMT